VCAGRWQRAYGNATARHSTAPSFAATVREGDWYDADSGSTAARAADSGCGCCIARLVQGANLGGDVGEGV